MINNNKGFTGRKHTEETKKQMSENNKGFSDHEHTEESKNRISKKLKGSSNAASRKFKGYYLLFTDPEGKEIKVDNNFNDFCKEHNIPKRSISNFLNNLYKGESVRGWKVKKIFY